MLVTQILGLVLAPVVILLIIAAGLVVRSPSAIAWFEANKSEDAAGV
jgi:hypothetical protein